ncbi:DUF1178 family protein [Phaeovibrio sulfidiphilus]|uniref:DUF1178 family protein n=1 Tax=Phaeovibrio sulfidiphilus TaxID=1220600 RepID=A0A8J6YLU1_9PROT|nr:DUF1178 family protein [Phaeovibrio sulfidiphilus]MBE1236770.1 DUF1178 family protein [Phaeovibrio sulfidiphilus]
MIRYALECEHEHVFQHWFDSISAADAELAGGQVACPTCGSHAVRKSLMAPSIGGPKAVSSSEMLPSCAGPSCCAGACPAVSPDFG